MPATKPTQSATATATNGLRLISPARSEVTLLRGLLRRLCGMSGEPPCIGHEIVASPRRAVQPFVGSLLRGFARVRGTRRDLADAVGKRCNVGAQGLDVLFDGLRGACHFVQLRFPMRRRLNSDDGTSGARRASRKNACAAPLVPGKLHEDRFVSPTFRKSTRSAEESRDKQMVAVFVLDGRLRCGFINNVAEFLVGLTNAQAVAGTSASAPASPDRDVRAKRHRPGADRGRRARRRDTLAGHDGVERPFCIQGRAAR